ncbi:MAG: flagellar protein FliT [Halioglobus sp.]|nr:flagellar protein FliT [Halioglobus sp.]|tara:strand:- start:1391 stop:1771 length:381 start_codon:yes stop_codon:yes gene_type:complete
MLSSAETQVQARALPEQVHQCRRLARVLEMTRQMLAHADKDEWEQVTAIERERRDDLVQCFSEPIPLGDSELVAEALATLLHLNEELMSRLKEARSSVMEKSLEFSRQRQAVSSYQSVDASLQDVS